MFVQSHIKSLSAKTSVCFTISPHTPGINAYIKPFDLISSRIKAKIKFCFKATRCCLPMTRKVRTHCSTEMIWSCFSTLDFDSQNKSCRAERMLDPVPKGKKWSYWAKRTTVAFQIGDLKSVFTQFAFRLVIGWYFPWSSGILEREGLPPTSILFSGCQKELLGSTSSHLSKPVVTWP